MDTTDPRKLETNTENSHRQAGRRRDSIERYWVGDGPVVSEMSNITKKLGIVSEGVNAWQKLSTTCNRIHHHCGVATSTFRCAHRKPNLAQVPSIERFRKLFRATPTYQMVSADLSGIRLRMLAHYLSRYDNGGINEYLLRGIFTKPMQIELESLEDKLKRLPMPSSTGWEYQTRIQL